MPEIEAWRIVMLEIGWIPIVAAIVTIALLALTLIAQAKVNIKAGEKGWKAFVPYWAKYTRAKLGGKPKAFWNLLIWQVATCLFMFYYMVSDLSYEWSYLSHPLIFLFVLTYISIEFRLACSFRYEGFFTAGLILAPYVFYPILAWNKKKYMGPQTIDMFDRKTGQRIVPLEAKEEPATKTKE